MTEPFLRDGLGLVLEMQGDIAAAWDAVRRSVRSGGAHRIHQHLTTTLASAFGYGAPLLQPAVTTREGKEDGGWLLRATGGHSLRTWSYPSNVDLDANEGSPRSCRFSPTRAAQRVLLAQSERAGLLTNGDTIRLLLCDPSRSDSHLSVDTATWRQASLPPDSFRILKALADTKGLPRLPEVLEAARLHQVRVTAKLRGQARDAIVGFFNALPDLSGLDPAVLWQEGLILVYRLLFVLKLESAAEPAAGFSFASSRLWRESLSPHRALAPLVRRHLDQGHDTGRMLESGLRGLFTMFRDGLTCSELHIVPLGGALFGADSAPLLDRIPWGDRAVAILLDRLIWIVSPRGERVRVHYGALDVEDLGGIYEGLLDQDPELAAEPPVQPAPGKRRPALAGHEAADDGKRQFGLRPGTGRKASGSFYTPHEFVAFLVRETLDPQIAALSPRDDPHPARLLTLKIVDPAMGSGHFLVEACRHLGEALLTASLLCDERGLHDRIAALPDPDQTIAAYLPSRSFSESRARAICRRLVAVHCLYGCDRNRLAVELAKVSLWLESYAEGLPLTFLDHRLVQGDALIGPFFSLLSELPVTSGPLDPLLAHDVSARLDKAVEHARELITELNSSIGRDITDLAAKAAVKERLDLVLDPLRKLAKAWAGAVMLRSRDSDDLWIGLATQVARTGRWPDAPTGGQSALLANDAVCWDLLFPEVFPAGFSVVLGNPPWDVVLPNTTDFVANYDPAVRQARTRAERAAIEGAVLARPGAAAALEAYRFGFQRLKRIASRIYHHQRARKGTDSTGGSLDLFRLFAERNMDLSATDGAIGVLLPSAFHANEGATGVRRLYLREAAISWCLSFENRRRIFDIDSRFKFDLIVARRPGPTTQLRCGFYLHRIEDAADPTKILNYTMPFLEKTGGTPLELRSAADLRIAETLFANSDRLEAWCAERHIRFGNDLHMTADAGSFKPPGAADLVLHEGKTFHQYTDSWDTKPRYSVASGAVASDAPQHVRLVFRDIARSNDERTMIACMAPAGTAFGHTATVERSPGARLISDSYTLCALFNSFPFDWLVRQKAATHLSLYLILALPVPSLTAVEGRFLAEAAKRLSNDPARWTLRAEVDALVAHSYGLTRDQYEHLLRSFSHRSYPQAPAMCLAAFDRKSAVPGSSIPAASALPRKRRA